MQKYIIKKTSSMHDNIFNYSSLVKVISENNFTPNKLNKWVKYRNILPIHKNANMGSSAIQHYTANYCSYQYALIIHCVDIIDTQNQN